MAGRPPKEKSFANMLNIAIKEAVEGTEITKLRAVADALVKEAMTGNVVAIKEVADRLDGKVPQDLDANLSGNVTVILQRFAEPDGS